MRAALVHVVVANERVDYTERHGVGASAARNVRFDGGGDARSEGRRR